MPVVLQSYDWTKAQHEVDEILRNKEMLDDKGVPPTGKEMYAALHDPQRVYTAQMEAKGRMEMYKKLRSSDAKILISTAIFILLSFVKMPKGRFFRIPKFGEIAQILTMCASFKMVHVQMVANAEFGAFCYFQRFQLACGGGNIQNHHAEDSRQVGLLRTSSPR